MKYGIAMHSIIPMRKEPGEQYEMVSQLLFGEVYQAITTEDHWIKIITQYDQYTGWVDRKLYKEVTESTYSRMQEEIPAVQSALLMSIEPRDAPPVLILAGSTLPGYNRKKDLIEIENEVFHIRWTFGEFGIKGLNTLNKTVGHFLNTPYLWGGRSIFGCDCSGFVQVVYKIHGIKLKRDSSQQAEQGDIVPSLAHARLGDLAFFADDEGKVYHTGLIISPDEIVHSSGYVHQDRLDEQGIFNIETQKYTHKLFTIRRVSGMLVS
jgi:gamma-D-glutamyl-L-lysine dipeptidyl-peptidase